MSVFDMKAAAAARALFAGVFTLAGACTPAVQVGPPPAGATSAAITTEDLRTRVYAYAHDSMMGREAPGPYNDKATDYIASEARRLGLEPAGEDGTFFQSVLVTQAIDTIGSAITVNGHTFRANRDFLPRWQVLPMRTIAGAQVVYGGAFGSADTMIDPSQTAGKVVVITAPPLANGQPGWQANRGMLTQRYANAAAIVVASLDAMPAEVRAQLVAPAPALRGQQAPGSMQAVPQFLYASGPMTQALLGAAPGSVQMGAAGATVAGQVVFHQAPAQARNVVAILRGRDPVLRHTYVAIGAHNDHVGFNSSPVDHDSLRAFNTIVRPQGADDQQRAATPTEMTRIRAIIDSLRAIRAPRPDSIYNGADDDASGSMSVLEIAEAMAKGKRPLRSILFVWHTAEEAGLLGAQYYAEHPTVPRDSIVAMINIDMIGRGAATDIENGRPGYLQLIGSRRLSTQLGDLVEAVNSRRNSAERLTFDYQYDADRHPQQYYCRSDHYHYARFGIPVVFFSSGGHRDYHMVTDEAQYIDYGSLRMVTQFIHDVAWELGSRAQRPVVDQQRQDPDAPCRQ